MVPFDQVRCVTGMQEQLAPQKYTDKTYYDKRLNKKNHKYLNEY